jgi:hypothetical protein
VLAAIGLVALVSPASSAQAADGVDLQLSVGQVTFGAGSSVDVKSLDITNAGPVAATGVTVTIDLISTGSSPPLSFIADYNGCAVASAAEVHCPVPDIAAGASYAPADNESVVFAKAIETHPVAGSSTPVPMAMKARITVSSQQGDLNPADNQVTADPVFRTVRSGPTDWVVGVNSVNRVGDEINIVIGSVNRGPNTTYLAEALFIYTAPPGTEWDMGNAFQYCASMIVNVKYLCNSQLIYPPDDRLYIYGDQFH